MDIRKYVPKNHIPDSPENIKLQISRSDESRSNENRRVYLHVAICNTYLPRRCIVIFIFQLPYFAVYHTYA